MNGPYGVGLWKYINHSWSSFSSHILFDIGDGSRVKFWHDRWCGESSHAVRYPALFRFCKNKEASVAELMLFPNDVLFWDVSFFGGGACSRFRGFVRFHGIHLRFSSKRARR